MYKYSLNLLPECIAHLYLRNDSIHDHNTRGCHELRVLPGAKTFTNVTSRLISLFVWFAAQLSCSSLLFSRCRFW